MASLIVPPFIYAMASVMSTFLVSQILAGISFMLDISAFHFRRRTITLSVLACSTSLLALHFYLLGQPVASGLMAIAACRFAVAILTLRLWVMWLFMTVSVICSVYFWQGLANLLPLAGSLLMTFASFQGKSDKLRGYTLCGSLCWVMNNVMVGSPVAILMEMAFSGSILLAAWRHHSATKRSGWV